MTISKSKRQIVIQRSGHCCEYCQMASMSGLSPFHVDHIIPLKHGGSDDLENLCFACYKCNAHKSHDLTGFDPLTGEVTILYHPRTQIWSEHFALEETM
ncbi:MAG: HNH endonuclease [Aggregatilineales bacterium]